MNERVSKISKKLLSLILNEEVKTVDGISNNALYYSTTKNPDETINLDTLGRLMKEWYYINAQGHSRWLTPKKDESWQHNQFACFVNGHKDKYVYGDTELETIVQATEWVAKKQELI